MKEHIVTIVLYVGLVVVGVAIGRWIAPTKTVEKTVTKVVEVAAKTKEASDVETRQADVHTVTRWRIHVVENPNGGVETTTTGTTRADDGSKSASEKTQRETQVVYRDREKEVIKVVESRRPDWSLEARIGRQLEGNGTAIYGGAASRRIIGSLSAVVYASTAPEVGLGIRWEF